jgi:methylmalonyl-CoA mutase N-terminal domain/subunit
VADPLGGSWYVEALTDALEAEAEKIFATILAMGERTPSTSAGDGNRHPIGPMTSGLLRGIEDGWFTSEIASAAYTYQTRVEQGNKKVVGVNSHTSSVTGELEILRVSHEVETEQNRVLAERRGRRDQPRVEAALAALREAARGPGNLVPPMLEAVRAEATLGEICDLLRGEWGEYTEPPGF